MVFDETKIKAGWAELNSIWDKDNKRGFSAEFDGFQVDKMLWWAWEWKSWRPWLEVSSEWPIETKAAKVAAAVKLANRIGLSRVRSQTRKPLAEQIARAMGWPEPTVIDAVLVLLESEILAADSDGRLTYLETN